MIKTKKLVTVFFTVMALALISSASYGQGFYPGKGFKQFNFGVELDGPSVPFYVGADFGVGEYITVGPKLTIADGDGFTLVLPSFRGDFHWSGLIDDLPSELDLYGGLTFGIAFAGGQSEAEFWLQFGTRYYFAQKWAVNLEFNTSNYLGSFGLSYRM